MNTARKSAPIAQNTSATLHIALLVLRTAVCAVPVLLVAFAAASIR